MIVLKKWFYIFSPCFICAILSAIMVIASLLYINITGGFSVMGIVLFLPAAGVFYVVDRMMKFLIESIGKLWICQTVAILFTLFVAYLLLSM